MFRNVDGVRVPMSEAEIAAFEASRGVDINEERSLAKLSRRDFCLAALGAGILTEADAIEAAKGGWPDSFAAAVPAGQEAAAQIIWASARTVDRMDPLLLQVAANHGITDTQLDAMFGIGG